FRMIDKYTISFVGYIKRYVFVRLFRPGPAILVPNINRLPIFDKRSKSLPESINRFPDTEIELCAHVGGLCMFQDIRHAAKTAAADPFAVLIKGDRPRKTFLNLHTQASICKNDLVFAVFDLRFFVCHMKSEVRSSV